MKRMSQAPGSPDKLLPGTEPGCDYPVCPIGKHCRLSLVNAEQIFVVDVPLNPGRCPNALSFGGAFFCRALWTFGPVKQG
mgnify:FL=1